MADLTLFANPDMVALVGHYRTGTHWLCALMALYFDHPVLPREYFHAGFHRPCMAFATHDGASLMGPRHQVIYLYRDPVDTVFSQSNIAKATWGSNPAEVRTHAHLYARHVARWLTPGYVPHLAAVRYECLQEDFPRICLLFNQEPDRDRIEWVFAQVTKDVVSSAGCAEPAKAWMARTDPEYAQMRAEFREHWASLIWSAFLSGRKWLQRYFDHLPEGKREDSS